MALPIVLVIGALSKTDSSVFNPLFDKCFINACQCLAFTAVFASLQVVDRNNWNLRNSLVVLSLFFGSQLSMNFAITGCNGPHHCMLDLRMVALSCGLVTTSFVVYSIECRNIMKQLWRSVEGEQKVMKSDQMTSVILAIFTGLFLAFRIILSLFALRGRDNYDIVSATSSTLVSNVIIALVAVVLPGRMIRRGMATLQREMDSKKTFIRYISHEIRSPLSTTSLGLEYLIDQLSPESICPVKGPMSITEILEVVKDAQLSCELATNTLNDLLMFDKIETGMLELAPTQVDAWEFVNDCVKPFQLQATSSGVALDCCNLVNQEDSGLLASNMYDFDDIEAQQPQSPQQSASRVMINNNNSSSPELHLVHIDKHKMEQVVRNFLTNALKFVPQHSSGTIFVNMSVQERFAVDKLETEASVKATSNGDRKSPMGSSPTAITTRTAENSVLTAGAAASCGKYSERDAVLRVEVIDNGPGITQENLPKLFGQYVQFDANTLQGGKGSGLGLWLSKAIVEMHGGVIGASSQGVGQGCTFYFELPCRVVNPAATQDNEPAPAALPTPQTTAIVAKIPSSADQGVASRPQTAALSFSLKVPNNIPIPTPVVTNLTSPEVSYLHNPSPYVGGPPPLSGQRQGTTGHSPSQRNTTHHVHSRTRRRRVSGSSGGSMGSNDNNSRSVRMQSVGSHSPRSNPPRSLHTGDASSSISSVHQMLVGLKVLLVDDSALARKMVARSVGAAHCVVHQAQNGLEAVQKVQQSLMNGETPFDAVVIDCFMPVMDGPEAVRHIRQSGFKGVVFAVTGASTNSEFADLVGNGVDCLMVKPFSMETFGKVLYDVRAGQQSLTNDSTPYK